MKFDKNWLTDPRVSAVNRLPAHSLHPFTGGAESILTQSLNGRWKFCYAENGDNTSAGFERAEDRGGWLETEVPSYLPPREPAATGCYTRMVTLPPECEEMPVFIRFEGVETAFALWCNGSFAGYAEDGFIPSEFALTPFLHAGENRLTVRVFRFCGGIFRDVFLFAAPKTHLLDLYAKPVLNKDLTAGELSLTLRFTGVCAGTAELLFHDETIYAAVTSDVVKLSAAIAQPLLWSAEQPNLYPYTVRLYDETGILLEEVTGKAGFRRFCMEDGLMKLNGKRIVFRGVNYNEWNASRGRAVTREDLLEDVKNLKRNNINAVRASRYPLHPAFYDLCDEYGLYVIDETGSELYGAVQRDETALSRVEGVFQRNKNHACILIWSCGNECAKEDTQLKLSYLLHGLDDSRLVRSACAVSDLESRRYTPAAEAAAFLKANPGKPLILIEYAHAMGNSCGGLYKYTELGETEPLYQGGFIWNYKDEGILQKDPFGGDYFEYGSFADRPAERDFRRSGLVHADCKNSPKMREVKFEYQDILLLPSKTELTIRNRSLFTALSAYTLRIQLHQEGVLIEQADSAVSVPPGKDVRIPLPFTLPEEESEYTITARLLLKKETAWAAAGYEIAFGQYVIQDEKEKAPCDLPVTVTEDEKTIRVTGQDFETVFSRAAGGMLSYRYRGRELLAAIPRPNFWRAPTDNDKGCRMPFDYARWKTAGLYGRLEYLSHIETETSASVYFRCVLPLGETLTLEYRITGEGRITVELICTAGFAANVPEFGMMLILSDAYQRVEYYGMGPEENYCDRLRGARLGRFSYTVAENLSGYPNPQECGNRTGVRFAKVLDQGGTGLFFESAGMDFSALPYTPHELENAARAYELPPISHTVIRCSAGQMGVGGDNSWGAKPSKESLSVMKPGVKLRFSFCGIA